MKKDDNILTLQELEQLCRLYMECRLSVLEETELQYVLSKTLMSSRIIDDTRILMGLASGVAPNIKKKRTLRLRKVMLWAANAAACLVLGVALFPLFDRPLDFSNEQDYCIAYVNGRKVTGPEARALAEKDRNFTEAFIRTIDSNNRLEEAKLNSFMDIQNSLL